jgi:hypothetical protein
MKKIGLLPLGFVLLIITTDAFALRCGRQLVDIGAHKIEVLKKCGEPEYTDERLGLRGTRWRHPPHGALQIDQYEQVVIEEWIYNFGPRKFKQLLLFENGILEEVHSLNYGD